MPGVRQIFSQDILTMRVINRRNVKDNKDKLQPSTPVSQPKTVAPVKALSPVKPSVGKQTDSCPPKKLHN